MAKPKFTEKMEFTAAELFHIRVGLTHRIQSKTEMGETPGKIRTIERLRDRVEAAWLDLMRKKEGR